MNETQLNGDSKDIVAENIQQLKQLFPEVFAEESIDFEKLKAVLGEYVDEDEERYNLTWWGKSKALHLAQTPSTGTLRPCPEESKDWDTTENLYIEGDNLEVLKLLQKTYHNKIKMIYIDPPYNTGKDFVYPDDYEDSIKNYLEITKQVDTTGRRVSTNSEASGRYHTNWLNMMYPRLRLARNLLTDDGVIFISIDDNEVENLKKISNEIFGEDNFVGTITWEKRTKAQNTVDAKSMLQSKTEYILLYKKLISKIRFHLVVSGKKEYDEEDQKGVFRYKLVEEMSALGMRGRETMIFPILGIVPDKDKQWKLGQETINAFIERNDIELIENKPYLKIRPTDEEAESFFPFWSHFFDKDAYGTAESGKSELNKVLGTRAHGFETVKPVELIKKLIFHVMDMESKSNKDFIILDFFSGSATTGHAVMKLNSEDQSKRSYILVQLQELTDEDSETYKAGYKNIAELGRDRIDRAGDQIKAEITKINKDRANQPSFVDDQNAMNPNDLDIGFKVFKLDSSNLRKWQPDADDLDSSLFDSIDNFVDGRSELDVVYEIMLKYGIDLTLPIEEFKAGDKTIFSVGLGALMICLDTDISTDVANEIVKLKNELQPEVIRAVFRDTGFKDDSAKTNTKEILRTNGVDEIVSI